MYWDLRYENFSQCENPCTKMKVNTQFKFKYQQKLQSQEKPTVQIIFPTEVELSVDTVTKSLFSTCKTTKFKSFCLMFRTSLKYSFSLVAEIGGFLGMILGFSLLDLEFVIRILMSMFQDRKAKLIFHWIIHVFQFQEITKRIILLFLPIIFIYRKKCVCLDPFRYILFCSVMLHSCKLCPPKGKAAGRLLWVSYT